MSYKKLSSVKTIVVLVAHDHRKKDLIDLSLNNRGILMPYHLIAAGTTEKLIEERLNIPAKKLLSSLSGSHQQISSLIVQGEVDVLIFFWAPMNIFIAQLIYQLPIS